VPYSKNIHRSEVDWAFWSEPQGTNWTGGKLYLPKRQGRLGGKAPLRICRMAYVEEIKQTIDEMGKFARQIGIGT